jgi:hypothetical protein
MAYWKSPYKPNDTVEILTTYRYPEVHGATGTVVLTMAYFAVIQLHSPTKRRLYSDMPPFTRIPEKDLRPVTVSPSAILPTVDTLRAERYTGEKAVDDPLPATIPCRRHPGQVAYLRQKNGKHWYSHRASYTMGDGSQQSYWCDGRLPWNAYEGMSRRYGNCSGM